MKRFEIQREIKRLLEPHPAFHRCLGCWQEKYKKGGRLDLVRYEDGSDSIEGLKHCDKVWWCNICNWKLVKKEQKKIDDVTGRWFDMGRSAVMVTINLPHYMGDDFIKTFDRFMKLFDGPQKKAHAFQTIANDLSILGAIRTTEVVFSERFGLSCHAHDIYFVDIPAETMRDDAYFVSFQALLTARLGEYIVSACKALGLRTPDLSSSIKVSRADRNVALYVCKPGFVSDQKRQSGSLSPFDLPARSLQGDHAAGRLWVIYAKATLGINPDGSPRERSHRRVRIDRDLLKKLGLSKPLRPPGAIKVRHIARIDPRHEEAVAKNPELRGKLKKAKANNQAEVDRLLDGELTVTVVWEAVV